MNKHLFFGPPGALYPDRTSNMLKMDDSVPPGGSYTYRWEVRPEFAPTDDDANCLTWVYHSHLDAPRDIASGLIGALLTCKKGRKNTILLIVHDRKCQCAISMCLHEVHRVQPPLVACLILFIASYNLGEKTDL